MPNPSSTTLPPELLRLFGSVAPVGAASSMNSWSPLLGLLAGGDTSPNMRGQGELQSYINPLSRIARDSPDTIEELMAEAKYHQSIKKIRQKRKQEQQKAAGVVGP